MRQELKTYTYPAVAVLDVYIENGFAVTGADGSGSNTLENMNRNNWGGTWSDDE